ncbi:GEM-LIKE PROTEIN 5 [Salix koriyanagi]|uniref:GEM-LIKE PROTEIN 5 n=1 Tax=Salix koriyanagi TaxID=2511006 RepID=A0A9Q0PVZ9_9ROSI|nr:GEM-LIKE PROTEIN 5 [Salix koriyanagi]
MAQQNEVPLPTLSAPKATEAEFHEPPSSSTVTEESQLHPPPFSNEETEKWVETGPSVPEAALGKVNLIARALTEDGFESLLKLIFETDPVRSWRGLQTGPVGRSLYLSIARVTFCRGSPLLPLEAWRL